MAETIKKNDTNVIYIRIETSQQVHGWPRNFITFHFVSSEIFATVNLFEFYNKNTMFGLKNGKIGVVCFAKSTSSSVKFLFLGVNIVHNEPGCQEVLPQFWIHVLTISHDTLCFYLTATVLISVFSSERKRKESL